MKYQYSTWNPWASMYMFWDDKGIIFMPNGQLCTVNYEDMRW